MLRFRSVFGRVHEVVCLIFLPLVVANFSEFEFTGNSYPNYIHAKDENQELWDWPKVKRKKIVIIMSEA